ncbi:acylphosphatase [Methanoculleus bourgensis]|jgi:acylphosphatase/DNA-binding transcriptional MerR regulator|uniref:acylphosphatase n=1 Tax=Methanoculleus bourgensis TaxID=83986 RepID=A0A0X3BMY9_9EURY|nr:acylphosphatase [Methanoculleus bourgensis]CVK33351.1 Acylphosphatase-like protein [Methanoculleus bourgensis]
MKRFSAVAAGRVQRVGFREHVYRETFNKDISGYVKNLDNGEVEIVAEGSEEDLRALVDRINIIRYPIAVKSFTIKWQEATGEFTSFEIIRGDLQEELFERVDFAGTIMYQTLENSELSLKKQDQMLDKQDQSLQLQHTMLDKQDQMLEKQDRMLDKQDQMLDKQDQMLQVGIETKEEIVGLRKDTRKYLDDEFAEIKKELAAIKGALARAGIQV